jgi:hypothetical protein
MLTRWRATRVLLCSLVLTSGAYAGCLGDEGNKEPAGATSEPGEAAASKGIPPNIVTDDRIKTTPPDSPGRAVLEWWQAVQFRDIESAQRLTDEAALADLMPGVFRRTVLQVGDQLPGLRLVGVTEHGETASARVFLTFFDASKPEADPSLVPRTIRVTRDGSGWRVADLEYLLTVAAASKPRG